MMSLNDLSLAVKANVVICERVGPSPRPCFYFDTILETASIVSLYIFSSIAVIVG